MTEPHLFARQRLLAGRAVAGALVLAAVAACGGEPAPEIAADPANTSAPAAPAAEQPMAGAPAAAATVQTVTIRVTDQGVEVSPATVQPGQVTFQVTNAASMAQEIEIDGPGEDGEIDDLAPNQTRSVTMMLQAADYEVSSSNEPGRDRTRRAVLTVRG